MSPHLIPDDVSSNGQSPVSLSSLLPAEKVFDETTDKWPANFCQYEKKRCYALNKGLETIWVRDSSGRLGKQTIIRIKQEEEDEDNDYHKDPSTAKWLMNK